MLTLALHALTHMTSSNSSDLHSRFNIALAPLKSMLCANLDEKAAFSKGVTHGRTNSTSMVARSDSHRS